MRLRGFLCLLGGALLNACVVTTNDGDRDRGSGGRSGSSGSAGSSGSSGTAGTAGGSGTAGSDADADSGGGTGGETDGATDGGGATDGSATDGGGDDGAIDGSGASGGTTGSGGTGGAAGSCNDSVGSSVDCSGINPDPSCGLLGGNFQKSYCERAPTLFKPRIAEHIASCIAGLSSLELCTPLVAQCIDQGLRSACEDTSVNVQCSAIVGGCPVLAAAECRLYLAGMTAAARARMVACLSSSCNLATCARDL